MKRTYRQIVLQDSDEGLRLWAVASDGTLWNRWLRYNDGHPVMGYEWNEASRLPQYDMEYPETE